ncbi:MAG: hypothetical protein ACKO46_06975 [Alphaproteobacteria bacterium]
MSLISKIQNLTADNQNIHQEYDLDFPKLDTEKLKQKLRLEEEINNKFSASPSIKKSDKYDHVEEKIILTINDEARKYYDEYYANQSADKERIKHLMSTDYKDKFSSIASESSIDFQIKTRQKIQEIETIKKELKEHEDYLQKFKQENNINHPATYPASRFVYYAIALFLLSLEVAVSGSFFAKGHEFGMVGGYMTAITPSFINIFFGFLLGNFTARRALHKKITIKLIGIFTSGLLLFLIASLNLLLTQYRAIFASLADNVSNQAFANFLANPLPRDVDSWLLFTIGFSFSMISAIDFFKMDDPYPNYGHIDREYRKMLSFFEQKKLLDLEELEALRNKKIEVITVEFEKIRYRFEELQSIYNREKKWLKLLPQHLNHLEEVVNYLLKFYRQLQDAPKYNIEKKQLETLGLDMESILQVFKNDLDSSSIEYKKLCENINNFYGSTTEKYQLSF